MEYKKKLTRLPILRFHFTNESWQYRSLNKITSYVDYRGKGPLKSDTGVFLVTAKNIKKGLIDYECSKEYVPEETYKIVMRKGLPEVGDVLFTTEAPLGNVAQVDRADIALAQRVIKFHCKDGFDDKYLLYYMLSSQFQKTIRRKAIGTTVMGIAGKELHKINICYPALPEQQKIASFLSAVDQKIQQFTRKKELLEQYKKGVMQKLFSQEIRFKDENGKDYPDWEEKRLGDVASFTKGKGISKDDVATDGQTECIRYGELYTVYSEIISDVQSATNVDSSMLVLSKRNDVIIPSSGETHIDLATASCVHKDGVALGGDINIIRSKQNGIYLAYYLNNAKKHEIAKLAQGNSVVHLYTTHLKSLQISLPSLREQQKITSFLAKVEAKIESVKTQITQTQQFKKGLLQQMFV